MLIKLAAVFDVEVRVLLDDALDNIEDRDEIAQKLETLNAILAEKLRMRKHFWRVVNMILLGAFLCWIVMMIVSMISISSYENTVRVEVIDE